MVRLCRWWNSVGVDLIYELKGIKRFRMKDALDQPENSEDCSSNSILPYPKDVRLPAQTPGMI